MATRFLLVVFSLVMSLMLVGCTTYYRITDPTTGKSYYATDFDKGRDGSITLTDEKSGAEVTVQNSEISELKQGAYEAEVEGPAPVPNPIPAAAPTTPDTQETSQ